MGHIDGIYKDLEVSWVKKSIMGRRDEWHYIGLGMISLMISYKILLVTQFSSSITTCFYHTMAKAYIDVV